MALRMCSLLGSLAVDTLKSEEAQSPAVSVSGL
jgi:hypothetical protein